MERSSTPGRTASRKDAKSAREDAQVLLRGEDRQRRRVDGGRDDRLDEGRDDRVCGFDVECAVQADDAAEGGQRVGVARGDVGLRDRGRGGHAARIGVLDDRRRRLVELERDAGGGVEVEQVGVGQLLALLDLDGAEPLRRLEAVPRRRLVRVLAVAQHAPLRQRQAHRRRQRRRVGRPRERVGVGADRLERRRDGRVIGGGVGEGAPRQLEAEGRAGAARGGQVLEHARVVPRVDHDQHVAEVLRRRPHHARPADVDLLDQGVEAGRRVGGGPRERIEVHDHQVDGLDAVRPDGGQVLRQVAPGQDAPVDRRVQGLDPPIEHLGEGGDVRDVDHREPGLAQRPGRPAGRQQCDAACMQGLGEGDQAGLVRDAEERPPDGDGPGNRRRANG